MLGEAPGGLPVKTGGGGRESASSGLAVALIQLACVTITLLTPSICLQSLIHGQVRLCWWGTQTLNFVHNWGYIFRAVSLRENSP